MPWRALYAQPYPGAARVPAPAPRSLPRHASLAPAGYLLAQLAHLLAHLLAPVAHLAQVAQLALVPLLSWVPEPDAYMRSAVTTPAAREWRGMAR